MTQTCKIHVLPEGPTIRARRGEILAEALAAGGVALRLYCGSRGICGKCLVEIVSGELPPLTEKEKDIAGRVRIKDRRRLACLFRIESDLAVRIPSVSLQGNVRVWDVPSLSSRFVTSPSVKKYVFDLPAPGRSSPRSLVETLWKKMGRRPFLSLGAVRNLPEARLRSGGRITAVLYEDREIIDVETGDTSARIAGVALDIGTTAVVAELVDLVSGSVLARASAVNAQVPYGADIISRVTAACDSEDTRCRLGEVLRKQIGGMILDLGRQAEIEPGNIYEIAAAGNTVMNHFLLDVPVGTLATVPFQPVFAQPPRIRSGDLGFGLHPSARVFISPNIAGFVGGDISAGMAALDLRSKKGRFLFVDLGTNGEIVLKDGPRMTVTSTAAGPAFEGSGTGCGMLALPGAVCSVRWRDGFETKTVGGLPARGVCGNGLVDILALSLKKGLLSSGGLIRDTSRTITVAGGIVLTQADIRHLQLAVAAVKSGARMILDSAGLSVCDLDGIFVAGAFGSSLDVRNAMAIGLIPDTDASKVVFVGNASLAGARKLLLSAEAKKAVASTVGAARLFSLASDRNFQKKFIAALEWGPSAESTKHEKRNS